jgi:hypothetical protein
MNGTAADFAPRRSGAEVAASIRVAVVQGGLYRISQPALVAAGVPATNLIGSALRLFSRTNEVSVWVSSDGPWTPADFLLFYASGFHGYYSNTNVYWLGFGEGGRRMVTADAAPTAESGTVTSYWYTVIYHRDFYFRDLYRPSDEGLDHWFSEVLTANVTNYGVLLGDNALSETQAVLGVRLHGYSSTNEVNPDHRTDVWITNGNHQIASFTYDGQQSYEGTAVFDASYLRPLTVYGLRQSAAGVGSDIAYLEYFYVKYRRRLWAEGAALQFEGAAGTNTYAVERFTTDTNLWALDVSDPLAPVRLSGVVFTNSGGYSSARFRVASPSAGQYLVCHTSAIATPASIQRVAFRGLASTNNAADYLILCPYEFRDSSYRLLVERHRQGLQVAVAPLPDVYNEFGYGLADAACIKQFLGYAFHHWRSPPRYVLLAGTGSYDPRHHTSNSPEWLPVHLGPSAEKWTALDGWFAQLNGDDKVPDVALGRVPVETAAQMAHVVAKILALEAVPTNDLLRTSALLVADKNDTARGYNFRASCEALRTNGLRGFAATTAYYDSLPVATMRDTVTNTVNAGVFVVCYFGHGAHDQWSGGASTYIINTNDILRLANTDFPVMTMLTCQNGAFYYPTPTRCLVEAALERAGRGAAACVAATALTAHQASEALSRGFYRAMGTERRRCIGDAMMEGYADLFEFGPTMQELLYFELFGDPAMVVNP